jgi:hypothetical protein
VRQVLANVVDATVALLGMLCQELPGVVINLAMPL